MKTFNKTTQKKYIERAKTHREADEIVRGLYWKDGKGCCIGCLAHANDDPHEALEKQTGIPEWLSRVADTIFEGLEDYKQWPERFVAAVPKNKTHDWMEKNVKAPFLVHVLKSTLKNFDHEKYPDVKKAVDDVIKLWRRDDIGSEDWRSAAESASCGAASAAWSAESAEGAARSAESAARSAWSAESAAWSAARSAASAAYKDYGDRLIEIMEAA